MHLVGLTGGIGSGKSTVAGLLADRGAVVIDADRIAREIVEPGQPALAEIVEAFGDEFVDGDGALRRAALAERVFGDEDARARLNAITHPRIADRIHRRVEALAARDEPPPVVVVDHPLLVETGQADRFPTVVVVTAPEETRVQRLVRHRGMDEGDVRARLRSQATDQTRRDAADVVLDNSGDPGRLEAQVDELWRRLTRDA